MTYDEMNNFILNYLKNDITGRAIMLTGEWGSGKSYYVKNTLKPFLEDKDNGKHKCVIVSLYGLSDTSEISKAIYMELRTIKKSSSSEAASTAKTVGKIIGKTVFNGLVSKIGFDIGSIEDKDFQEIYESVDLTDKLIVLEDIERTQIDIIELLGYINNMCENDGVKVLLVTNESELLHFHMKEIKKQEYGREKTEYIKVYSEDAQKYLKAKEKSISDTLQFHADFQETIGSIIDKFENDDLSSFKGVLTAPRRSIMRNDITNYREVIVACQKACDIYNYMKTRSINADSDFKKCILIGLVNYLQQRLDNPDLKFKANALLDSDLSGDSVYPLMRLCYDYYHSQIITQEAILKTVEEYKDYLLYVDRNGYNDKDLKVIYSPYINTESDVNLAIDNILSRLDNIDDISFKHYDRIINTLLVIKFDIKLNNTKIDLVISKIISNLKQKGDKYDIKRHLFTSGYIINDSTGVNEFERIKNEIYDALNYTPICSVLPSATNCEDIITKLFAENVRIYKPYLILEKLKFDTIIQEVYNLHPDTISKLRSILSELNYSQVDDDMLERIKQFKDRIKDMLEKKDNHLDLIQQIQLQWTCKMIDDKIPIKNE